MQAIVPHTSDKKVGLVRSSGDLNNRVVGMDEGINNKMKCNYSKVGIEYPPLEVMFTSDLEVRRLLVVDGDNRPVVTSVHQLSIWGNQGFS